MKKGICPKCKQIKTLGYLGRCLDCNIKIEDGFREILKEKQEANPGIDYK